MATQLSSIKSMNGHSCSTSSLTVSKALDGKKRVFNIETVEAAIAATNEFSNIDGLMWHFYAELHRNQEIPQYVTRIKQLLRNNNLIFDPLSAQEKAQVLFNQYLKTTLSAFYRTDGYQKNYIGIYKQIAEWVGDADTAYQIITRKIDKSLRGRIPNSFVTQAIAEALAEDHKNTNLSFNAVFFNLGLLNTDVLL